MPLDIISVFFPLMLMVIMSIFIALLTNRSPSIIMATCGMVLTILIWQGIVDNAFYVVVALFIGVSLWLSIGNTGSGSSE